MVDDPYRLKTMLNPSDLTRMAADLAEIVSDNPVTITIRRGQRPAVTLPPQTVRIETGRRGRSQRWQGQESEESRGTIVVVGDKTLDIQKDDTFTVNGQLHRVLFVSPNEQMGIQAEAELIQ